MKFGVNYNHNLKSINKFDEVAIRYENNIIKIVNYIKNNPNQRVIIDIDNMDICEKENLIEKFLNIKQENEDLDFSIKLVNFYSELKEKLEKCKGKLKFFFSTFVKDWDTFRGLINLGVSDIYLVENMCFELDKAAAIAHTLGVQIRVFGNIAQSAWIDTPAIKKFFIRPEDVLIYEPYVDVIEFFGSIEQISVAFDYYSQNRQWFGDLNEIILSLHEHIDNRFIVRDFAEKRVRCGKKCMKNEIVSTTCHMCDRIVELSHTLKNAGIMVKIENKEENEDGKTEQ